MVIIHRAHDNSWITDNLNCVVCPTT